MSNSRSYIFLNDELTTQEDATIPAVTSGLYYGAGCFETFVSERGKIFRFQDHIRRLNNGLKYLGVESGELVSQEEILKKMNRLLKKNRLFGKKARIRIQVSLSEASGYSEGDHSSSILIITSDLIDNEQTSKCLILSKTSVIPSSARPSNLKLSNMLHYRHAFKEAEKRGADDSIMLNVQGYVAETSIANLFWKKGNKIYTPSEECDILPGIMRNSLIELLRDKMNVEVYMVKYSLDDLMNSDSVWLTNSVLNFCPVKRIENVPFETGNAFYSDLSNDLSVFKAEDMTHV